MSDYVANSTNVLSTWIDGGLLYEHRGGPLYTGQHGYVPFERWYIEGVEVTASEYDSYNTTFEAEPPYDYGGEEELVYRYDTENFEWVEVHPLSQRFHEILNDLGKLHDKKQKDYGRSDDPFANVRGTEDWGQPAWVGAMIRGTDKMKRLQTYARTGELANEGVEDAFMDLAVYAVIGLVLWEEANDS